MDYWGHAINQDSEWSLTRRTPASIHPHGYVMGVDSELELSNGYNVKALVHLPLGRTRAERFRYHDQLPTGLPTPR